MTHKHKDLAFFFDAPVMSAWVTRRCPTIYSWGFHTVRDCSWQVTWPQMQRDDRQKDTNSTLTCSREEAGVGGKGVWRWLGNKKPITGMVPACCSSWPGTHSGCLPERLASVSLWRPCLSVFCALSDVLIFANVSDHQQVVCLFPSQVFVLKARQQTETCSYVFVSSCAPGP